MCKLYNVVWSRNKYNNIRKCTANVNILLLCYIFSYFEELS